MRFPRLNFPFHSGNSDVNSSYIESSATTSINSSYSWVCLNYVKAPWVLAPLLERYQLLARFSGVIDLALVRQP